MKTVEIKTTSKSFNFNVNNFGNVIYTEVLNQEDNSLFAIDANNEAMYIGSGNAFNIEGLEKKEFNLPDTNGTTTTTNCYYYEVENDDCISIKDLQYLANEYNW